MNLSCIRKLTATFLVSLAALTGLNMSAQNYRLPGQHTQQSQNLLANQSTVKPNALLTPTINYLDYEGEEMPEGDLYELGWESNRVNCYANVDVPQSVIIDVRNFAMPHPGYITSPYGYRPRFKRMHRGVDIHIKMNDTIRAAFDGRVRITNYEANGYGNYVVLRHYNDLETVYGHLQKFLVKNDQYVKAGQPIALGGSTGHSTGPHLYFETRYMGYAINPAAIFDFPNQTTHTDTYTFNKNTYEQARNYSPKANADYAKQYTQKSASVSAATETPKPAATKVNSTSGTTKAANAKVPASKSKNNTAAKKEVPKNNYATVRSGDSLTRIANRYKTTVDKLCKLNGVTTKTKLQNGQKLRIR